MLKIKSLTHFIYVKNIKLNLRLKVLAVTFIKPLLHEKIWIIFKQLANNLCLNKDHPLNINKNSRKLAALYETKQGLFLLDQRDQFVAKVLIDQGHYGQNELSRILALADSSSSILMLGPHVGALAIPLSKKIKELVLVEANPDTYALLSMNIILNNCKNIKAHHAAANHITGQVEFLLNTVNSGGSKRMPKHRDDMYFYDNPNIVKVPALRLDELINDNTFFEIVIMDIEGSEYFAMKGMPKILSKANHLITEFIPHHLDRVGGITVGQFLEPISNNFQSLFVPSLDLKVKKNDFNKTLEYMYQKKISDDGIIFSKF